MNFSRAEVREAREMEALLPHKTPLYYALTAVMCILPFGLNWLLFSQNLNWLGIAAIYVVVLAPLPYLLTLALNLDIVFLLAPELKHWKKQVQVGLIFGFPFALGLFVIYYLYSREHTTILLYNLGNQAQGALFAFFFTLLYPIVEAVYYRAILLRAVTFKPHEGAKLLNVAIYSLTYYAGLRFVVSSEEWAWLWFGIIFVWARILIQIKSLYGGLAAGVGHALVNLSLSIILINLIE